MECRWHVEDQGVYVDGRSPVDVDVRGYVELVDLCARGIIHGVCVGAPVLLRADRERLRNAVHIDGRVEGHVAARKDLLLGEAEGKVECCWCGPVHAFERHGCGLSCGECQPRVWWRGDNKFGESGEYRCRQVPVLNLEDAHGELQWVYTGIRCPVEIECMFSAQGAVNAEGHGYVLGYLRTGFGRVAEHPVGFSVRITRFTVVEERRERHIHLKEGRIGISEPGYLGGDRQRIHVYRGLDLDVLSPLTCRLTVVHVYHRRLLGQNVGDDLNVPVRSGVYHVRNREVRWRCLSLGQELLQDPVKGVRGVAQFPAFRLVAWAFPLHHNDLGLLCSQEAGFGPQVKRAVRMTIIAEDRVGPCERDRRSKGRFGHGMVVIENVHLLALV